MDLFSYILAHDSGFAPNPYHGFCTLACCKPVIRRVAQVGDWVMGTASKPDSLKLIYIMKVARALPFDTYFNDPQYRHKKNSPKNPLGDNIYKPVGSGKFKRMPNPLHGPRQELRDLKTNRVLISDHFYYFGDRAPELAPDFGPLIHSTQGHKRIKPGHIHYEGFLSLLEWLQDNFRPGIHGKPRLKSPVQKRAVKCS